MDATLPAGVTLEFDGRAQAMLSYEVKNYALLRHDGRLELRGAAFESSRTEAYSRAFLQQALCCLLSGDVPGVRQAFLDARHALETRACTNAEVASRVRLTKSPEQYAATRGGRREATYETLHALAWSWRAGERISLYHRTGHGLTPLDVNPEGRDYNVGYYTAALVGTYTTRLRKGLAPSDFTQLFDASTQPGLFDRPFEQMQPRWTSPSSGISPTSIQEQ